MTSRLFAAPVWVKAASGFPVTEDFQQTPEGREINSHTFIGLGIMAMVLVVVWLIRRSRA